jgi:hypothetical protein
MNYTVTIRNHLSNHKCELFDLGYEYSCKFGMMDKKTFTRIIGRLEDEGILHQVAKGVYYINGDEGYSDQKIIEYYVNNFHGMIICSSLFSKLNIKDNEDGIIDIITNKIDSNKTIGKFKFYKVEIPLFDNDIIDIITLLELFESLREPYDNNRLLEVVRKCISNYNDSAFELIIKNTDYKYSTIEKLVGVFSTANKANKMIKIYKKCGSYEQNLSL